MKNYVIILSFIFSIAFGNVSNAQDEDIDIKLQNFLNYYSLGDLVSSEYVLHSILDSNISIPKEYFIAIYNNLGAINMLIGKYESALEYYNKAEILIEKKQDSQSFADICSNKAFIYTIQKSFNLSIEYLEKSIRIYSNLNSDEKNNYQNLSSAYLNIGITYLETGNSERALEYFKKSSKLKLDYKLSGLALVYVNIAKTYVKTRSFDQAETFFLKSIEEFDREFGPDYYRVTSALSDYGLFLRTTGRSKESLKVLQKALSICLKNYGKKHTLVSLSYKRIGDHFVNENDCDSALCYYQKSLIAVVNDFNDPDIFANPSIDSAIFDIRLLDNLKSKAKALELMAGQQKDHNLKLKTTEISIETMALGMKLIDIIRNNYLSEESRIYLAENEKETYLFATHLANSLFKLTNDKSAAVKMYDIAKKAKAAILRNEITENELVYSVGISDSLLNRQDQLSGDISAYNNLILTEMRGKDPDNKKISLWKDALFKMNRENEKVKELINNRYPQYNILLHNTEPLSLDEIQHQLSKEETVIDYLLSNQYTDGKRRLYIFIITKNGLEFRESNLDSLFIKNVDIIRNSHISALSASISVDSYRDYTAALYYMYENLIKPVEETLSGKRLIIIPDEEIGWLTFDSFLRNRPEKEQIDFEGLQYLIRDYSFSFGYSSSLIFRDAQKVRGMKKVYAFSPDYSKSITGGNLQGAADEIKAIFRLFGGKIFTGEKATETNFRNAMQMPAIFHMAMHSLTDSLNSRYSYMMFDAEPDSLNDGKLYNYEISLSRINSPMVVLSACNSGTGTLYHGEGLMSLARGFLLAGASSVIKTAWEVNDETSAAIIKRFYFHLSKGKPKDEALRLAKLDYMKTSEPVYNNPYYWAAYEVLGDNSKVTQTNYLRLFLILTTIAILAAGLLLYYFRRRRIFSARSL